MSDAPDPDDLKSHTARRTRSGSPATLSSSVTIQSGSHKISTELATTLYRHMIRTRAMEERSIKMSKSGEAYFWVGGPGEEALNVCLGLQIHKGHGPAYDYLHMHYRNGGAMIAMGMPMLDHFRQLAMASTDRHSKGRNFVCHYAIPEWNVIPVTSVIEVQMVMALGTARVQKRAGGEGISVAMSGDAGAAAGDFESCLIWSTRPGNELPVLIVVTNNGYGISTKHNDQHAIRNIADRAEPYGMRHETVDGNDPVATWCALEKAMNYVRTQRKPFLFEAHVSRLHGHSSSSGAQREWTEPDCVALFEQKLIDRGALDAELVRVIREEAKAEADEAVVKATSEPKPTRQDVYTDTYAPSAVDCVYPRDYTGLPRRK